MDSWRPLLSLSIQKRHQIQWAGSEEGIAGRVAHLLIREGYCRKRQFASLVRILALLNRIIAIVTLA